MDIRLLAHGVHDTVQGGGIDSSAISAIAAVVNVVVVLVAVIVAYTQLHEANKSRHLDAALAVLQYIDTPDSRLVRRFLIQHAKDLATSVEQQGTKGGLEHFIGSIDTRIKALSGDVVDHTKLHAYLASLENIAIITLNDLAPDGVVDMYFGEMIPAQWDSLQPYIRRMRQLRGDGYLQHLEMLKDLLQEGGLWIPHAYKVRRPAWFFARRSRARKHRKLYERHRMRLASRRMRRKSRAATTPPS